MSLPAFLFLLLHFYTGKGININETDLSTNVASNSYASVISPIMDSFIPTRRQLDNKQSSKQVFSHKIKLFLNANNKLNSNNNEIYTSWRNIPNIRDRVDEKKKLNSTNGNSSLFKVTDTFSNSKHANKDENNNSTNSNIYDNDSIRNTSITNANDTLTSSGLSPPHESPTHRQRRNSPSNNDNDRTLPKPLSMPGLILAHGYPAEVHRVTTEDGYILELHRIPGPRMIDASIKKKRGTRVGFVNPSVKNGIGKFNNVKKKRNARGWSHERRGHSKYRGKRSFLETKQNEQFTESEDLNKLKDSEYFQNILRDIKSNTYGFIDANTLEDYTKSDGYIDMIDNFNTEFMSKSTLSERNYVPYRRKSRSKRSNARAQFARNRKLIRSMDPRIIIHRRMTARRRNGRTVSVMRALSQNLEVNAKRSINEGTIKLPTSNTNNGGNIPITSSVRCFELAQQCNDKTALVAESINRKILACEKLRACTATNASKLISLNSDVRKVYFPTGDPLIIDHDHSINNEINNVNRNIKNNSSNHHSSKFSFKAEPPNKKKVVFIQHCLQCSSADFVLNDHNQALGFVLADAGYDVWLGNFRGNQYSKRHKTLSPRNVNYWKFNVDDLAKYDLPAMVEYVLRVTESKDLYYIGHSLGTVTFFMASSTNPDFMSKIRLMVALAPAGYLDHMRGGLKIMLKSAQSFYRVMEAIGVGEVGGVLPWRGGLMRRFCKPRSPLVGVCAALLPSLSGRNSGLHDQEYLPLLLANFPSGTSFRLMAQLGQIVGSDGLRKFNFGSARENREQYGLSVPPHYPLEKITCPVAIMWAENDYIVTPQDVARTASRLGNVVLNYRVPHDSFNHVDFLFADIARHLVYEPIMELLSSY